ncbi:hypothetical protein ACQPZP_24950 [Spirillospora sp. CA-142024]|uniref:ATP-binding protein n=1 Tax=Spirillospora sp. CA-142024 TaxID=3240036 RepID=UPI003D902DFA
MAAEQETETAAESTPQELEDAAELASRVGNCLEDPRLATYVKRHVDFEEARNEVMRRGVFEPARQLDSYNEYTRSLKQAVSLRRRIDGIMERRVLNAKTVLLLTAAAVVVILVLGELRKPDDQRITYLSIAVFTALFAVCGGWTLWAAVIGQVPRKHIVSGSLITILTVFPVGTTYEHVDGLRFQPVLSFSILLISFVGGVGIAKPETRQELMDIKQVLGLIQLEREEKRKQIRLRRDWLDDAFETVLMPLSTQVINDFLGEDQDKLLVEQNSQGLKRLHDLRLAVDTRSQSRVFQTLNRIDGGSIAIAGPRGAGKTTLLRLIRKSRQNGSSQEPLAVGVAAPAEYTPRDFLVELFQRLCEAYITAEGHTVDRTAAHRFILRKRTMRVIRDGLWTLFRAVLALALVLFVVWTARVGLKEMIDPLQAKIDGRLDEWLEQWLDFWRDYGWACQLALLVAAVIVWPRLRIWRHLRWHAEPRLVTRAREHLLRLQVERTTTWGLNAGLPGIHGATMGLSKGDSLKYLPWSFPELVRNFRDFVEEIAKEGDAAGPVIITIDEVDRMGSVEKAERFISEIKAVFGIRNCFYIVSIAEEVGSVFARRAVAGRSIFENAFDDVVVIEPLYLAESRRLLLRRVPGFTDSFAYLAHSLSGGVPRELIRVTRRLVEINLAENKAGRTFPRLDGLAAALVKEEMTETLVGIRTQLSSHSPAADLGGVFDFMRSVLRDMRLTVPCDMTLIRPRLYELTRLEVSPPPDASEADPVGTILIQLSGIALFCLTIIEVFEDGVFELRRAESVSSRRSPASFEELAAARRELSVSPSSCRAVLTRFREAWNLPLV